MYILELYQEGISIELATFNSVEEGREFISKLEGYRCVEEDGFLYESIKLDTIPNYLELEFNNNVVPITKFMFVGEGDIDVFWKEIPNLSMPGSGMVDSVTRVDAYAIENNDVKSYIENREKVFDEAKSYLEEKGFEVSRSYFGSEDGEAILYKKKNSDDWHFLTHLDPMFCDVDDVKAAVDEFLEM